MRYGLRARAFEVPGHFIFYEVYSTRAAHDAHVVLPHAQARFARLPELIDGGLKWRTWTFAAEAVHQAPYHRCRIPVAPSERPSSPNFVEMIGRSDRI